MGRSRWVVLGAGAASVIALLAAADPLAPLRPEGDWAPEAGAAARQSIVDRAPDGADVRFADVKVRRNGSESERSVCGTFAVRGDDGSLGPYRDFWVVVTKHPDTWADIQAVRPNTIAQDAFFDRSSAYYMNCFADGE